jgi:two-component system sensor histidine kinase GlrK
VRLASKIFLATALLILGLVGIGAWSLRAVNDLVRMNREMIRHSLPALHRETLLEEAVSGLLRLQTRYAVLGDPAYESLWRTRAERTAVDLVGLRPFLTTRKEQARLRKAIAIFDKYRAIGLPRRGPRRPPTGREARVAGTRAEAALRRLRDITYDAVERAEAAADDLERRTWRTMFAILPLVVFAGLVSAGVLAFRLTRSLRRLSAATADVAEGSFQAPVRIHGRDEVGELATAFNRMAERLAVLDRTKEEFFAHISHELRTPLTSVREAASLLRERVPGPLAPKQERLVGIIGENCERVLRLVNQILELSRLQAGLRGFDRRSVDVDRLVGRALEQLRPEAEARGVTLARVGAGRAGRMLGDEDRLLEVLVNLLANAIRFTPEGGTVRVHTFDRGETIEVAVEDTGVGIPSDALPHVFDRYWQAAGVRDGSGLGLAIVKSIVQAHGGGVRAESTERHGSRFTVRLPRRGPVAA